MRRGGGGGGEGTNNYDDNMAGEFTRPTVTDSSLVCVCV